LKFKKYGKENENLTIEIEPLQFVEGQVFRGLDNLIETIKTSKPDILEEFMKILAAKLQTSTDKSYFVNSSSKLAELVKQYANITKYQELLEINLNFFLDVLGINEEQFWENKMTHFPATNFFPSANRLSYAYISLLVEIIGKEEAIEFYKKVINNYIATYDTNQKGIFENLEKMRESWIRSISSGINGRVRTMSEVENGAFIIRAENCEKIQNLGDLSNYDKDLLSTFVCHCHFPLAELWNENFVLTQQQTIAKGDPYCEYVYHDKRLVGKVEHPPKEFFEKIKEEN